MERTPTPDETDPRRVWATWLRAAMTRHYGEGFKNNQLAQDTKNVIREQTVSRWLNAEVTPSIHLARLAAITLDANLADAYIAAGYGNIVEEVSQDLAGAVLAQRETEEDLQRELDAFQETVNEKISELRALIQRARARPRDPDPGTRP